MADATPDESSTDAKPSGSPTEGTTPTDRTAGPPPDEPIAPQRSVLHRVVAFVITSGVVVAIFVFLIPKMLGGTEQVIEAVKSIRPVT